MRKTLFTESERSTLHESARPDVVVKKEKQYQRGGRFAWKWVYRVGVDAALAPPNYPVPVGADNRIWAAATSKGQVKVVVGAWEGRAGRRLKVVYE